MNWIKSEIPGIKKNNKKNPNDMPDGLWLKCDSCNTTHYHKDLIENLYVCVKCNHHMRINAKKRADFILDLEERIELARYIESVDILKFQDTKKYSDRLIAASKSTNKSDAIIIEKGKIKNHPVILACFEFSFMGGSMGSVVGEKFVRAVKTAIEDRAAFICVSCSGGARMQEGLFSLMQMAKTNSILTRLSSEKLPFISILTDPTMGGVSASFSFMGDIVIAEPRALIGFAGPRVIEQTVQQKLPDGFQRSEFLLQKGAIDMIIDRRNLRDELSVLLSFLERRS